MKVFSVTVSTLKVHAEDEDAALDLVIDALSVDGIEEDFEVSTELANPETVQ